MEMKYTNAVILAAGAGKRMRSRCSKVLCEVGGKPMLNWVIDAAKKAYPRLSIISSGHSYGRQFAPHMAAGFLAQGSADMAGFGRMSFAYPNFARDILNGTFDGKKTCIACGKCSLLMRAGTVAGCPVRDSECYMPYFQKYVMNK